MGKEGPGTQAKIKCPALIGFPQRKFKYFRIKFQCDSNFSEYFPNETLMRTPLKQRISIEAFLKPYFKIEIKYHRYVSISNRYFSSLYRILGLGVSREQWSRLGWGTFSLEKAKISRFFTLDNFQKKLKKSMKIL